MALQALQTVPHGNVFVNLVLSHKKLLSSILQSPELELKHFPDNFKYVFIGNNNTLLIIIVKGLTSVQEKKLVKLLCDHKTTIGWTLADIKGINPSMCIHHILLEDNTKPTREMQRRLNPDMIKRLMFYPKCRSVEVINNLTRSRSNHKEVNSIKLQIINEKVSLIPYSWL